MHKTLKDIIDYRVKSCLRTLKIYLSKYNLFIYVERDTQRERESKLNQEKQINQKAQDLEGEGWAK